MVRRFLHAIAAGAAVWLTWCGVSVSGTEQQAAAVLTVDDLMRLSSIVDVQMSPDGKRVAYVVSTPNLSKNEQEPALFVVPAAGGTPVQIGESVRIFNQPSPRPQLRWMPDGQSISVLGFAEGRPEVFAMPVAGGAARQITRAPQGVAAYEWSPDGRSVAFLTADPMPPDEERRREDKSYVIVAG